MKEVNTLICSHCGSQMNIAEFAYGNQIVCPKCDTLFTSQKFASYSCPTCFSPFLVAYENFETPILLCSNSQCPSYTRLPDGYVGGSIAVFSYSAFNKQVVLLIQDDFVIGLLDGGNNGAIYSDIAKNLAKSLYETRKEIT